MCTGTNMLLICYTKRRAVDGRCTLLLMNHDGREGEVLCPKHRMVNVYKK